MDEKVESVGKRTNDMRITKAKVLSEISVEV
jgi:hypothetical protein